MVRAGRSYRAGPGSLVEERSTELRDRIVLESIALCSRCSSRRSSAATRAAWDGESIQILVEVLKRASLESGWMLFSLDVELRAIKKGRGRMALVLENSWFLKTNRRCFTADTADNA